MVIVKNAFDKVEKLNRMEIIYNKKTTETSQGRNFPLVCDFNPALPPIGKIINKYKYILDLDAGLKNIIPKERVFVSYRGNKTIKDILVPSRLRSQEKDTTNSNNTEFGCFKCNNSCKTCELFLHPAQSIRSYHTNETFQIKQNLNCRTENVVYVIEDLICNKIYTGCTTDSVATRFSNHKSHIRKRVKKSCELSVHFLHNEDIHIMDKKGPLKQFDETLAKQLRVTVIEKVSVLNTDNKVQRLAKCKLREAHWQNQLKTLEMWGGLNKRDSRKEVGNYSSNH